MHTERTTSRIIVGAAIVSGGRLLACERDEPPHLAGLWEFPGGKVEPGESDRSALARECVEELGIHVDVGDLVAPQVPIDGVGLLRVYAVRVRDGGEPRAIEHRSLRWLSAAELDDVPWVPGDSPIVDALRERLA